MSVVCHSIGNVSIDDTTVGNVVDAMMNYSGRRREILDAVMAYEASLLQALSDAEHAASDVPTLQSQIASLQSQITALQEILNPPNAIWPNAFSELLTDDQLAAIYASTHPAVIRMRTRLTTIVSPMPFSEDSQLYMAVQLLGLLLPELFTEAEVTRILNRQAPE